MAMYVWQTRMKNKELVKQNSINKAFKSKTEIINNDDKKSTPEIKIPAEKNSDLKNKETNSTEKESVTNNRVKTDQQLNSFQQKIPTQNKRKPNKM